MSVYDAKTPPTPTKSREEVHPGKVPADAPVPKVAVERSGQTALGAKVEALANEYMNAVGSDAEKVAEAKLKGLAGQK